MHFVIFSPEKRLFWSNRMGWVDRTCADVFDSALKEKSSLPFGDAEWVPLAEIGKLPHDEECACDRCEQ